MTWMPFTYDQRYGGNLYAQPDGRALIEYGEIAEIELEDIERGGFFTVGGSLGKDISLFLRCDPYYRERIAEIAEDDRLGRITADRETTLKLRREAA